LDEIALIAFIYSLSNIWCGTWKIHWNPASGMQHAIHYDF